VREAIQIKLVQDHAREIPRLSLSIRAATPTRAGRRRGVSAGHG
jgi:hypothetical protein